MKQMHVFFSGNVQGVGFRYTAQLVARGFAVTGWVKNLPDGRVELVAEGEKAELESYLQSLCSQMEDHIRAREIHWEPVGNPMQSFKIIY